MAQLWRSINARSADQGPPSGSFASTAVCQRFRTDQQYWPPSIIEQSVGCAQAPEFPFKQPRLPVSGQTSARRDSLILGVCADQALGRGLRPYSSLRSEP